MVAAGDNPAGWGIPPSGRPAGLPIDGPGTAEPIWPDVVGILCILLGIRSTVDAIPLASLVGRYAHMGGRFWVTDGSPVAASLLAYPAMALGGLLLLLRDRKGVLAVAVPAVLLATVSLASASASVTMASRATSDPDVRTYVWAMVALRLGWDCGAALPLLVLFAFLLLPSVRQEARRWRPRSAAAWLSSPGHALAVLGIATIILGAETWWHAITKATAWSHISGIGFHSAPPWVRWKTLGQMIGNLFYVPPCECAFPVAALPLCFAGIGLLRHRRWGLRAITALWATVCTLTTVGLGALVVLGLTLSSGPHVSGREVASALNALITIGLWPLLATAWLRRPHIRAHLH